MNLLNLIFLLLPLVSWIGLKFLPSGDRMILIYYTIFVIISLGYYSIKFYSFLFIEISKHIKIILFLGIFLAILIYGYSYRWMVEPFGMNDSNVLWNVKATFITNMFLGGENVSFSHPEWKHNSYPIGLPTSLAFLSVIMGMWTLSVPYGFVISLSTILILNFMYIIIYGRLQSRVTIFFLILIFISWMLQFNTFMIQSDLCADYPIIFGISLFSIFFFSEKTLPYEIWSLLVAWIVSMKNEGIILLPFLIFLIYLKASQKKEINIINIFKFFIVLLLAIVPLFFHKLEAGILHQDFGDVNNKLIEKPFVFYDKFLQIDRYLLIGEFLLEYQFKNLSGIPIITTILILTFSKDKVRKIWIGIYWILHFTYSFIYLMTNLELFGHLDSSYVRIQSQLLPMITFIIIDYIQNDENCYEFTNYITIGISKLKWVAKK